MRVILGWLASMKLRFAGTTLSLALGVTAAVVIASSAGAYLYSSHHFQTLLESARAAALGEGELIRIALEHQMIENDRTLIAKMIENFGSHPGMERVVLLDRHGIKRFASRAQDGDDMDLHINSPTCQAC